LAPITFTPSRIDLPAITAPLKYTRMRVYLNTADAISHGAVNEFSENFTRRLDTRSSRRTTLLDPIMR
jgi:hypothetical protein